MSETETETIFVELIHSTDDAILVNLGDDDENYWIPKAVIEDDHYEDAVDKDKFDITVPVWLAEKENLI